MADALGLGTVQERRTSILPPTIESASQIAPTTFLSRVSGSVPIATIVPPVDGAHLLCLVFIDSLPGSFLTTGNIANSVTLSQNVAVFLTYDPISARYYANSPGTAASSGFQAASFLVTGGQIVWVSAYNFIVTAATYIIDGVQYSSPETAITLDSSHATLDRIDVIAVTTSGTAIDITGVAAAQPAEPEINPAVQLKLGIVFVGANTTEPTVTSTLLYAENTGGPGEWNWATSGVGWNANSTNNPIPPSTKSIDGTAVAAAAFVEGTIPSGVISIPSYRILVLPIRPKSTWSSGRGLTVSFRNSSSQLLGLNVNINRTGTFGFNHANIAYQVVAIPTELFGLSPTDSVAKLRITDFGGAINLNIDNITLQRDGATAPVQTGITQDFADARYLTLATEDSIGITVDGSGSALTTGQKGYRYVPYGFEVTGWTLISDQVGSVVFDIWVDLYPNVPVVADTITAAAKPTLSAAQVNQNFTLTGWNKGPFPLVSNIGRLVGFNIDSVSTITRVTLTLHLKKINTLL